MRISQFVISSDLKFSRNVFAFTQEGVTMLSGVLRSDCAVQVLKSQSVISNDPRVTASRSQIVILKRGLNIKYPPYAFTEQGEAMLSEG